VLVLLLLVGPCRLGSQQLFEAFSQLPPTCESKPEELEQLVRLLYEGD
jgi:hypothetical protein